MYNETILNELIKIKKEKNDLTHLCFYLAKEPHVSAIKILTLLTIANQEKKLKSKIDFNKKFPNKQLNEIYQENISSRLINNHLYIAQETFAYISKTTKIDFNFRTLKNYSLKELLIKTALDITNPDSKFYQLDNLAFKNLELIRYFATFGTMNINNTMEHLLLEAYKKIPNPDLKILINYILYSTDKIPHKKYDDRIKENLKNSAQKIFQEKYKRQINNQDYQYFHHILVPKLINHEIKLK